jgi:hypothetical protein
MINPREPREFADMGDSPHNNGYWNDERRGLYYGRVNDNSDEIDEDCFEDQPEDEEDDREDQSNYEGDFE